MTEDGLDGPSLSIKSPLERPIRSPLPIRKLGRRPIPLFWERLSLVERSRQLIFFSRHRAALRSAAEGLFRTRGGPSINFAQLSLSPFETCR